MESDPVRSLIRYAWVLTSAALPSPERHLRFEVVAPRVESQVVVDVVWVRRVCVALGPASPSGIPAGHIVGEVGTSVMRLGVECASTAVETRLLVSACLHINGDTTVGL